MIGARNNPERLYLDLLKNVLTGFAYLGTQARSQHQGVGSAETLRRGRVEVASRVCGNDLPYIGLTMTGLRRMEALESTVRLVLDSGVPGDVVECGVWQGGASAYLIGLLCALGDRDRTVWLADSFGGFAGIQTMKEDAGFGGVPLDLWAGADFIAVSQPRVQANLAHLGLAHSASVHFQQVPTFPLCPTVTNAKGRLQGYFNVSLPKLAEKVSEIAVLRMDGDMYESTMDILFHLYDKVALGGVVRLPLPDLPGLAVMGAGPR